MPHNTVELAKSTDFHLMNGCSPAGTNWLLKPVDFWAFRGILRLLGGGAP